jgi:hypothetical protein
LGIVSKKLKLENPENILDINDLPSGIYFIRTIENGKISLNKIIKN